MPLILGRGHKAATLDIMHCDDAFLLNDNPNPDVIAGAIRFYHGNSGKIMRLLDFTPKQNIRAALGSLCRASCEGDQPEIRNGNRRYDTPCLKALDAA